MKITHENYKDGAQIFLRLHLLGNIISLSIRKRLRKTYVVNVILNKTVFDCMHFKN